MERTGNSTETLVLSRASSAVDTTHHNISKPLVRYIKTHFSDSPRIIKEFGVCEGVSRVDIAVINGNLHGFEIKSDADTLERLPSQAQSFAKVFDYLTIVVGSRHIETARGIVPKWWGIIEARKEGRSVKLYNRRRSRKNPEQEPCEIVKLLWADEARQLVDSFGLGTTRNIRRIDLWTRLASDVPLETLKSEVCQMIKARRGWRVEKRPTRGNDSFPTDAKTQRSRENLQWLLEQGSADRLR